MEDGNLSSNCSLSNATAEDRTKKHKKRSIFCMLKNLTNNENEEDSVIGDDAEAEILNKHIGDKIKSARLRLGFTQTAFSDILSITFQQIQKYEKGSNRISAIMLWQLSQKLGIDISYFFPIDNLDNTPLKVAEKRTEFIFDHNDESDDVLNKDIGMLVKDFSRIKNSKVRKKVIGLVSTIVKTGDSMAEEEKANKQR